MVFIFKNIDINNTHFRNVKKIIFLKKVVRSKNYLFKVQSRIFKFTTENWAYTFKDWIESFG